MSKAFVKEDGDGSSEVLLDREISPHANLVTAEGMAQIEATIAKLQAHQAEGVAPSIARDLRYWTAQLSSAQLTPDSGASQVKFGSRVTVEHGDGSKETYRIVGIDEADPKRGTVSYVSPLAQALIRSRLGRRAARSFHFPKRPRALPALMQSGRGWPGKATSAKPVRYSVPLPSRGYFGKSGCAYC